MSDFPLISHGCWYEDSGDYSDFLQWRACGRAAGMETEFVKLGPYERELPVLDYDSLTEENILGLWKKKPKDVLLILLAHSDEEGMIYSPDARELANRLEKLLPKLPQQSVYTKGSVRQKAEVMRTEISLPDYVKPPHAEST